MPTISRFYFGMAILYLMSGITLGLAMAISQNHSLAPVHAHINLLGWVTSALFGGYYALNPQKASGWLPRIQCTVFTLGLLVMLPALYYLYVGHPEIEPVLGGASMAVALGVVLFAAVVFTRGRAVSAVFQPAE
jgi:glucose-6-phosphate-specific signal transduction histidine kinase